MNTLSVEETYTICSYLSDYCLDNLIQECAKQKSLLHLPFIVENDVEKRYYLNKHLDYLFESPDNLTLIQYLKDHNLYQITGNACNLARVGGIDLALMFYTKNELFKTELDLFESRYFTTNMGILIELSMDNEEYKNKIKELSKDTNCLPSFNKEDIIKAYRFSYIEISTYLIRHIHRLINVWSAYFTPFHTDDRLINILKDIYSKHRDIYFEFIKDRAYQVFNSDITKLVSSISFLYDEFKEDFLEGLLEYNICYLYIIYSLKAGKGDDILEYLDNVVEREEKIYIAYYMHICGIDHKWVVKYAINIIKNYDLPRFLISNMMWHLETNTLSVDDMWSIIQIPYVLDALIENCLLNKTHYELLLLKAIDMNNTWPSDLQSIPLKLANALGHFSISNEYINKIFSGFYNDRGRLEIYKILHGEICRCPDAGGNDNFAYIDSQDLLYYVINHCEQSFTDHVYMNYIVNNKRDYIRILYENDPDYQFNSMEAIYILVMEIYNGRKLCGTDALDYVLETIVGEPDRLMDEFINDLNWTIVSKVIDKFGTLVYNPNDLLQAVVMCDTIDTLCIDWAYNLAPRKCDLFEANAETILHLYKLGYFERFAPECDIVGLCLKKRLDLACWGTLIDCFDIVINEVYIRRIYKDLGDDSLCILRKLCRKPYGIECVKKIFDTEKLANLGPYHGITILVNSL